MKINTVPRPYVVTFRASGHAYVLTSDEVQRLLDEYPAVSANSQKVVLQGHNTTDPHQRTIIQPAAPGGGPAFIVVR